MCCSSKCPNSLKTKDLFCYGVTPLSDRYYRRRGDPVPVILAVFVSSSEMLVKCASVNVCFSVISLTVILFRGLVCNNSANTSRMAFFVFLIRRSSAFSDIGHDLLAELLIGRLYDIYHIFTIYIGPSHCKYRPGIRFN